MLLDSKHPICSRIVSIFGGCMLGYGICLQHSLEHLSKNKTRYWHQKLSTTLCRYSLKTKTKQTLFQKYFIFTNYNKLDWFVYDNAVFVEDMLTFEWLFIFERLIPSSTVRYDNLKFEEIAVSAPNKIYCLLSILAKGIQMKNVHIQKKNHELIMTNWSSNIILQMFNVSQTEAHVLFLNIKCILTLVY